MADFLAPILCGGIDMKLHPETTAAIVAHAETEYPRECCGFVLRVGKHESYMPCRNIAATASEHFKLHPEDAMHAEDSGEILALVHSHPDAPAEPSDGDRAACEQSGIPWLIFEVREGTASASPCLLLPCGWKAPLLGRMFFHGVLDCMSIVRDFYAREFAIDIQDPDRDDGWWDMGQDLYMDNYKSAGFVKLPEGAQLQFGDVVLMAIRAPVANHAGVFIGGGKLSEYPLLTKVPNAMLHHLYGRVSERVVYGGYWAETTLAILRHESKT